MGRGYVQYLLPESGREEWVLCSAFIDYRLTDGAKLHILQQSAWCSSCDRFVIAEEIPSLEALKEEIDRFVSAVPDTLQKWAFVSNGSPVAERIAELRRYIAWVQGRKSPPRCLECGALNPVPIPMHGEFTHPRTGERVLVAGSGFADTAPWFAEFTPEGKQIAEQVAAADRPRE